MTSDVILVLVLLECFLTLAAVAFFVVGARSDDENHIIIKGRGIPRKK